MTDVNVTDEQFKAAVLTRLAILETKVSIGVWLAAGVVGSLIGNFALTYIRGMHP